LNVILAQVGAPVCAAGLTLPRVRVRTSMHIEDALERGTSLFMAELLRIRGIVAAAREPERPLLLYLGDEMLHGTNTEERRIALVAIIETLLRAGAVGAVATHLDCLFTNPVLAAGARPIHFSDQYRDTREGPVMSFDYRVRPGLATTRNGLKLLALVGLTPSVTS
jgi:DNA mismatch repair ATPase MutS